jgi:hypothetical protein
MLRNQISDWPERSVTNAILSPDPDGEYSSMDVLSAGRGGEPSSGTRTMSKSVRSAENRTRRPSGETDDADNPVIPV